MAREHEPSFLQSEFLQHWRDANYFQPDWRVSDWGPWRVAHVDDPTLPWKVLREWERPSRRAATGHFSNWELASLVASLLPHLAFEPGYVIRRQEDRLGHAVAFNGELTGYIETAGGGRRRRLESALRMVAYLASSPQALSAVLKSVGYEVGVRALEQLDKSVIGVGSS